VTYSAAGTYTIKLTVFHGADYKDFTQQITVKASLTSDFTFAYAEGDDYSPATVNFTDVTAEATSWAWTFDGGSPATSTQKNPSVSFANYGFHEVVFNANGGDVAKTDIVRVLPRELICGEVEAWVADLSYPQVGKIGEVQYHLGQLRSVLNPDGTTNRLLTPSWLRIQLYAEAVAVLTQGAVTTEVKFEELIFWDWFTTEEKVIFSAGIRFVSSVGKPQGTITATFALSGGTVTLTHVELDDDLKFALNADGAGALISILAIDQTCTKKTVTPPSDIALRRSQR
jgi:PKD repeat protein